jgi:hypothetical protein
MVLYSIIRGTGHISASQVSSIPKTLFAVKIKPFVPHILHPLVLWTQSIPPLEYGALLVSTIDGDKAKVSFGPNQQHVLITSPISTGLEINIHSDFKKIVSVAQIHHLYALGDQCIEKVYNTSLKNNVHAIPLRKQPAICDIEELK